ncbi:hypothetical protein CR513_06565, partial [Mucuna pruriens]
MLQLMFAVAFSAMPLTLYIPPIRSFNLFVESLQNFIQDSFFFLSIRAIPRIRLALSRFFYSITHITCF